MPVGEKQKLITEIIQTVLVQNAHTDVKFDWFLNKHSKDNFKEHFEIIDNIFNRLNGSKTGSEKKLIKNLQSDAYFGGEYNFFFEFDEIQHFSTYRKLTFDYYPENLKLNFDFLQWKTLCERNYVIADRYRQSKKTKDFDFKGGRTAQRAYLDCFRDLLPKIHGLNPTLRISEFEVIGIDRKNATNCKKIEKILSEKLNKNGVA